MTNEDIEYIKYAYENRQKKIRPDVKRIVKLYNEIMDDKKHVFHKISENMCACSLSPYLKVLYNKVKDAPEIKDEKQDATRKVEKESVRDTSKKKAKTAHTIKNNV